MSGVILAKIWGILLTLIFGTYLLRPSTCTFVLEALEREEFVVMSAWLSIILGVTTLVLNRPTVWEVELWGGVLTLNGLFRLAFPSFVAERAPFLRENKPIPLSMAALGFLLGVWLLINYL
ncbi:hypothetical protein [Thermovibrio sp.]